MRGDNAVNQTQPLHQQPRHNHRPPCTQAYSLVLGGKLSRTSLAVSSDTRTKVDTSTLTSITHTKPCRSADRCDGDVGGDVNGTVDVIAVADVADSVCDADGGRVVFRVNVDDGGDGGGDGGGGGGGDCADDARVRPGSLVLLSCCADVVALNRA